jgi:hypothetical protein
MLVEGYYIATEKSTEQCYLHMAVDVLMSAISICEKKQAFSHKLNISCRLLGSPLD